MIRATKTRNQSLLPYKSQKWGLFEVIHYKDQGTLGRDKHNLNWVLWRQMREEFLW